MRLHHLKILTRFRGLPPDSEFNFNNVDLQDDKLEPICLVGLNGSGKSNLLEVIAEIFYFLDRYVQQEGKPSKQFSTDFGFEITYSMDITWQSSQMNWKKFEKLSWEGARYTVFTIRKESKALPTITLESDKKMKIEDSNDPELFILPIQVIAYSSGHNELLSNPFIKSSYHYFKTLDQKESKDLNIELALSRLFHLDYENSKFVAVCNYLFAEKNNVHLISKEVGVDDLDSFNIIIRYRNYRNSKIEFAQTLLQAIENMKSCATAMEETTGTANFRELKLSFKVDAEMRRAFQQTYGSSILLFRDLYFLNLMNIHCHAVETRSRIQNAGSMEENLSSIVPVPPRNRLVFLLEKVKFRKSGVDEPIKYKNLSDGEHQLMHILGSIMLLNVSGSLLLYDEPETHFNPEWRAQLITLINKATKEKNPEDVMRRQEIFITSHSPFIVSDCRKERVFIFDKGKAKNPKINTFGTSVNILTEEVFGKKESISEMSINEIIRIKAMSFKTLEEIQAAKESSRVLGESVEKVLLFRELLIRENKLKKQNDKKL
jgi:restriction system-associated AAA family ATPase